MKSINRIILSGLLLSATLGIHSASAQTPKASVARPITVAGIVAGAPQNGEFFLRANGQTYRVRPLSSMALKSFRGGDRVRVFGIPTGLNLQRANVRLLQNRASDNPDDYQEPRGPITKPRR